LKNLLYHKIELEEGTLLPDEEVDKMAKKVYNI
jgi:hypothetical protein